MKLGNTVKQGRTKIEQLGLDEALLKLHTKGMSIVLIAKTLSDLHKVNVTTGNVHSFLECMKKDIAKNTALSSKLDNAIQKGKAVSLMNWSKAKKLIDELIMDQNEVRDLLKHNYKNDENLKTYVNLISRNTKTMSDLLKNIATVEELISRRIGGLGAGERHYHFTNIENQYNDLMSVVVEAEEFFPGIAKWVESKIRGVGGLKSADVVMTPLES